MILGIDEVGRGPWAGPLVVGAVVLGGVEIDGLDDSKKLTKKRRETLDITIRKQAAVGLGWVSARELDEVGVSEALRLATRRAVEQIKVPYHEIVIDVRVNFLAGTGKERYVTMMPKADALVPSVSAASIVAKVARDRYMAEQDAIYPGYNFAKHAGYGVAAHRAAINQLGVCPEHRLSFAPLQKYRPEAVVSTAEPRSTSADNQEALSTTRRVGDESETVATKYLRNRGHEIIERNWRTRWCEIDIISQKNDTVYFVEVKHRQDDRAGDGLAAITPKKLRQMKFAAELYASKNPGRDQLLAVISTSGTPISVVDYLELR